MGEKAAEAKCVMCGAEAKHEFYMKLLINK